MPQTRHGVRNQVIEWSYTSGLAYVDPFNEVEVSVAFTGPDGGRCEVPAFWAGANEWRVRFAPPLLGSYSWATSCSDASNGDLHGQSGNLVVSEYSGRNGLLSRGRLRITADRRHLEHADGTPFFWLADTWWMSLCKRLEWPRDFQVLTADRKAKGFTVIQLVAGLYPDMPHRDGRGANEAGFPWSDDYKVMNPQYFDMADLRIAHLVSQGIVPCIVGCWGYFMPWMGVETMKTHWRNLVARYGAYPVVWCLAGEGAMPYYLSEDKQSDAAQQICGWTELAEYVRQLDPNHNPVTIHPTDNGRDQVLQPGLLDFEMLQTGHGGHSSVPHTAAAVVRAYEREPRMPVVNAEVCYEGILEGSREEIQRMVFWICMLSGAAGHTYGANGLWQLNTAELPYGPSPHGSSWGDTPWQEAYQLPGAAQVAAGKRILERYDWWRFEPHQEWITPAASTQNPLGPYAAGIPGETRVVYFPTPLAPWSPPARVRLLEPTVAYCASYHDPKTGRELPLPPVHADDDGSWAVPYPALMQDWVLVLQRA